MNKVLMNGKAFNESALFSRSIFVLWLLRSVTLFKVRHRREMDLLQSDPVKPLSPHILSMILICHENICFQGHSSDKWAHYL